MTPKEVKMRVYERLMEASNNNLIGVCCVMANIQAECDFRENWCERRKCERIGETPESYLEKLKAGDIPADTWYRDSIGFGLCQWTWWEYKRDLKLLADKKGTTVFDLDLQIDFLINEINRFGGNVKRVFYNKGFFTLESGTRIFMTQYERPADQSEVKQLMRCGYANDLFKHYKLRAELDEFIKIKQKGKK